MSWGNVIHRALEALPHNENLSDTFITHLLQQEGRPTTELPDVRSTLENVMSTPLWQRLRAATEKWTEVPFGIYENGIYLTGTIDLAFREKEGWILVDYKTDTVRDDIHLADLVAYYQPQVGKYAEVWKNTTGEAVKEYGLFFTHGAQPYYEWRSLQAT
ncbi:MAG: PD-(D/E)XK nuclease family protein [Clostridium sp.]|nr:PD-(D/E)XK nuclease family protein [Clostridium sp.]